MSVQQELDRRVSKLDKRLKEILALYLLHQLSLLFAKLLADKAIDEAYTDFMKFFKSKYKTTDNYNEEANRIMKVLDTIRRDFYAVLEKKGTEEQVTERALKLRTYLIALGLIYSLHREATIELAIVLEAPFVRWNTQEDENVCTVCEGLKGLYKPHEVPDRPHPNCRCYLTLEF